MTRNFEMVWPTRDTQPGNDSRGGKSSVRSAMSVVSHTAPSDKLCKSDTISYPFGCQSAPMTAKAPFMPLLRSLSHLLEWRFYKHGAPNGACADTVAQDTFGSQLSASPFAVKPII